MVKRHILASAALALSLGGLGATPAAADDPSTAPLGENAKDDANRRICRSVRPTGTRMATRVCRTQAQWDRSRDKTQDGMLQHQMKEQTTLRQQGGGI